MTTTKKETMGNSLNENEMVVLVACKTAIYNYSRVEFGEVPTAVEGLSSSQIKGYISQLSQKGMIELFQNGSYNNVSLTLQGVDYLIERASDNKDVEILTAIKDNI